MEPIQAAVAAAEEAGAQRDETGIVTLSTGVMVRAVAVPEGVLMAIQRKFKPPKVPMWHNAAKGRAEENPDDPDYLAALAQYQADYATATVSALLLRGAEIVHVPDGFPRHDAPEWIEELDVLSLSSGASDSARRIDWLMLKACATRADMRALTEAIGRATGATEGDVSEAVKSVRS